ncbi:MAG: hypothetical protein Q7J68_08560 [Thermoplasmata archaeon]|nr:hypothetical protein [Thermoplasmata archaeon]
MSGFEIWGTSIGASRFFLVFQSKAIETNVRDRAMIPMIAKVRYAASLEMSRTRQ